MADEAKARAFSGEIMADPPTGGPSGATAAGDVAGDIIDAEYISLPADAAFAGSWPSGGAKSPASIPSIGSAAAPSGGMDMLRRPDAPPMPQKPARGGPLFWSAGVGLAVAAFWVSGGHALLRGMPFVGADAPHGPLRLSGVTSRIDATGARPVLFIDGDAANDGRAVEHLPALAIAVTGNDGRITRYRLGTSGRPLSPGETFAFSSRLDVPKNGVKTVSVAFAE
jgi:hypothetical protein